MTILIKLRFGRYNEIVIVSFFTIYTLVALRRNNLQFVNLVQSLNSPFFPAHIGAEPGRAKEESRITCMRMLRANQ